MLRPIAHSKRVLKQVLKRVLAWLIATSCAAHAGEATEPAVTAPAYPKLTAGAVLMSDYIYRGISYSAHQPALGAYVDVQHGWLYAWTNFNSVKFSTSPAAELTMAAGIRPTLGSSSSISAQPITTIRARSGRILRTTGRRTRQCRTS